MKTGKGHAEIAEFSCFQVFVPGGLNDSLGRPGKLVTPQVVFRGFNHLKRRVLAELDKLACVLPSGFQVIKGKPFEDLMSMGKLAVHERLDLGRIRFSLIRHGLPRFGPPNLLAVSRPMNAEKNDTN